jgi:ribosomal protein S18 acetylase RimI-like enzyme
MTAPEAHRGQGAQSDVTPAKASSPDLEIVPLGSPEEADECARIMSATDPWVRLQIGYDKCLGVMKDPIREVHVARTDGELVGFIVLVMTGAFVGYIQTLCLKPEWRNKGIGTTLLRFAEERIFSRFANVFMCVSSFNEDAQRLYRRIGYEVVGELKDYVVPGHSEILLRKSIAPLALYQKPTRSDTS